MVRSRIPNKFTFPRRKAIQAEAPAPCTPKVDQAIINCSGRHEYAEPSEPISPAELARLSRREANMLLFLFPLHKILGQFFVGAITEH